MRVDAYQHLSRRAIDAGLGGALALPHDLPVDMAEGDLHEFAHRPGLAGREHVVVGSILLQDPPHALDVIACMPPIALGLQITEVEALVKSDLDPGDRARNLAGHKRLAPDRALVV